MWTILVFITNQLLYSFRMYINITTKRICSIVFQLKEFKCSTFLYINSNRPGVCLLDCLVSYIGGVEGYVRYLLKCIENIFIGRQQNVLWYC